MSLDTEFEHEQVKIVSDHDTGLTAIVALHSTALGPAMGGLRLRGYAAVSEAVDDALRLSRAMSMKNAVAGLELGGAKMVLLDDGGWQDPGGRAARMRAVGRIVDSFDGSYITAEDVGTTPADMDQIATATRWVYGRPIESGGRGNPGSATAGTVFAAIRAAARVKYGADSLGGLRVGVQGAGSVGSRLVELLCDAGAEVEVTDAVQSRATALAARTGAHAVSPEGFIGREVEILSPCGFGEVIGLDDVDSLHCAIVAGAANNPLATAAVAAALAAREILYVPDYMANCGGMIYLGSEPLGLSEERVEELMQEAAARIEQVLAESAASGRLPLAIAQDMAEQRIASGRVTPAAAA